MELAVNIECLNLLRSLLAEVSVKRGTLQGDNQLLL